MPKGFLKGMKPARMTGFSRRSMSERCKLKEQHDFVAGQVFIHRAQVTQIQAALEMAEQAIKEGRGDIAASMCYDTVADRAKFAIEYFGSLKEK